MGLISCPIPPEGLEPSALRLEVVRAIQLRHEGVYYYLYSLQFLLLDNIIVGDEGNRTLGLSLAKRPLYP